jgi:hypothetical protein
MCKRLTPKDAATKLLECLGFPQHSASVWIMKRGGEFELVVKLDEEHMPERGRVPLQFEGFPVRVEKRGIFHAL